jgi:hypothetical protein
MIISSSQFRGGVAVDEAQLSLFPDSLYDPLQVGCDPGAVEGPRSALHEYL